MKVTDGIRFVARGLSTRSLFLRISWVFLVALLIIGIGQYFIVDRIWVRGAEEVLQRLNWDLAENYARELQPLLLHNPDSEQVNHMLSTFAAHNPQVEISILLEDGKILFDSVTGETIPDAALRDTTSLKQAITPTLTRTFPIHSPNPARARSDSIFSVAPVIIDSKPGYVFVSLVSARFTSIVEGVEVAYVLLGVAAMSIGIFLLIVILGMVLFFSLTRRFGIVLASVQSIANGTLEARVPFTGKDEIGQLAGAINTMAETIEHNVKELERRDSLRRTLIADVSHDLRGPVAVIQGNLEVIANQSADVAAAQVQERCATLLKSCFGLSRLLGELFELAKLEAKEMKPQFERFSIGDLSDGILENFRELALAQGVTLSLALPEERLPAVLGDDGMIERVLSNLLENAIRHTPSGGSVELRLRLEQHSIQVIVADTGTGISSEELQTIFERFRQSKKPGEPIGAGGLGLAIVNRIVELHSSHIHVESEDGRGCQFSFALALAPAV